MKNIAILSMMIALLVIGQICCQQNGRRRVGGEENGFRQQQQQQQQYPRPPRPLPGGGRFGEEYGWRFQRGDGDGGYHSESMWKRQPNNGWKDNSNINYKR